MLLFKLIVGNVCSTHNLPRKLPAWVFMILYLQKDARKMFVLGLSHLVLIKRMW